MQCWGKLLGDAEIAWEEGPRLEVMVRYSGKGGGRNWGEAMDREIGYGTGPRLEGTLRYGGLEMQTWHRARLRRKDKMGTMGGGEGGRCRHSMGRAFRRNRRWNMEVVGNAEAAWEEIGIDAGGVGMQKQIKIKWTRYYNGERNG